MIFTGGVHNDDGHEVSSAQAVPGGFMARKKGKTEKDGENGVHYLHKNVMRLNIPPAGLTARGEIGREKKVGYAYNPPSFRRFALMQMGNVLRISRISRWKR